MSDIERSTAYRDPETGLLMMPGSRRPGNNIRFRACFLILLKALLINVTLLLIRRLAMQIKLQITEVQKTLFTGGIRTDDLLFVKHSTCFFPLIKNYHPIPWPDLTSSFICPKSEVIPLEHAAKVS
jgi:hypothetical protein